MSVVCCLLFVGRCLLVLCFGFLGCCAVFVVVCLVLGFRCVGDRCLVICVW